MPSDCDCYSCVEDRLKEQDLEGRGNLVTCTCAARYNYDADTHESDCELWLLEEFYMGWLAWDCFEERLYQTDAHPNPHAQEEADEEYEWLDPEDADIALTTDKFIERMTARLPEDEGDTWSKDDHGNWVKSTPTYSTTSKAHLAEPSWAEDWYWTSGSDRHTETPVHLPSGEHTVYCTSASMDSARTGPDPDFGLYADGTWAGVPWLHMMLPWQDFGLPRVDFTIADDAIKTAYEWVKRGKRVEMGCIGAHGRTGTMLACMAILDDPELTAPMAVSFVKASYCHHAIETQLQEWYVARFRAVLLGEPVPAMPKPKPVPVAKVVTATPKAQTPPDDGPSTSSRKKSRRSKRGGKRNRARQGVRK